MIVCGIDPGFDGAITFLDSDGWFQINDMPTLALVRGGKNKRELDAHRVGRYLGEWKDVSHAFIEQVGAMPGQGVSSVFAFGKSYGIIIGALATLKIPYTFVPPRRWKTALGVPAAKDGARSRASQLLPQAASQWVRVKDDGRAESALIALYGLRSLNPAKAA